jgi:hypothetical protein
LLRGVAEAAEEGDFNCFDVALCDVPAGPFLLDVFAVRLVPIVRVLEAFEDFGFCGRLDEVLGDFLRDFLDIRLPFVAFGGSIITVLRTCIGVPDSSDGWASLTASGYGYKKFDAPPVRSLSELLAPDDEQQD